MSAKHEPGPWNIAHHQWLKDGYVSIDAKDYVALAQVVWRMSDEEATPSCEANARLIAAAPELLEALQTAYEALQISYPLHGCDMDKRAGIFYLCRTAIAKATGGHP